ncbi:MAG: alpha/beta hydrolase family protein [Candidatus Nanohaloarchaea archaeon]
MKNEEHLVEVENGEKVAAVHHRPESNSQKWMFFCHGFGSDKEGSYERRSNFFSEHGWNAVRFDFRGNGDSDGKFIEQDLSSRIRDLKAVLDRFKPQRYVLFGSSFGGKVALTHAAESDPEAVIGRSPVTYNSIMDSFRSVVEEKGEFQHHPGATIDERFFDDLDRYSFGETAEKIECPVAIFHGSEDTTVHPGNSVEAAGELEDEVLLNLIESEKHSFSEEAERKMLAVTETWLNSISMTDRNSIL